MKNIDVAKNLLEWNRKNLVSDAALKKTDIGTYFATQFQVKANGRHYDANFDNYFEFLNQFRSTIRSIDYTVHDYIEDAHHVVMPLTAHIIRVDGSKEDFEAILILKMDAHHKITLWHEVYVKSK